MRRGGRPDNAYIPVKDMQSVQLEQLNKHPCTKTMLPRVPCHIATAISFGNRC